MESILCFIFSICLLMIIVLLGIIIYELITKKYKFKIKNLIKFIIVLFIIVVITPCIWVKFGPTEEELCIKKMEELSTSFRMPFEYDTTNNNFIIKMLNKDFEELNLTTDEYINKYLNGDKKIEENMTLQNNRKDNLISINKDMIKECSNYPNVNINIIGKIIDTKSNKDIVTIKNGELEYDIFTNVEKEKQVKKAEETKKAEEAKKEKEKEASYNTGITYEQLARTPDEFKGKKAQFTGKVVQVVEGDKKNNLRVAIDDNYDNMLFVEYDKDILNVRILKEDYITIKGTSLGIYSYESTLGQKISLPSMLVEQIELNN